jgi:hypothetical protein
LSTSDELRDDFARVTYFDRSAGFGFGNGADLGHLAELNRKQLELALREADQLHRTDKNFNKSPFIKGKQKIIKKTPSPVNNLVDPHRASLSLLAVDYQKSDNVFKNHNAEKLPTHLPVKSESMEKLQSLKIAFHASLKAFDNRPTTNDTMMVGSPTSQNAAKQNSKIAANFGELHKRGQAPISDFQAVKIFDNSNKPVFPNSKT